MKPANALPKASDSTRILEFRKEIRNIRHWMDTPNATLPPPPLLIIYPTYTCTNPSSHYRRNLLCSNCIYQGFHSTQQQLDIQILSDLLHEAIDLGIRNIQFSGGGEPLEYQDLDKLFDVLYSIRKTTPDLLLGLLTNGLYLREEQAKHVATLFSYVRLSFAEGPCTDRELMARFSENLRHLLAYGMSNSSLRIGLKLLVSHTNCGVLGDQVLKLRYLIGEYYFTRLNHIRVKAMRSVNPNIEPTEQDAAQFTSAFDKVLQEEFSLWPDDVQIDLDLGYTNSDFRCYLSPLFGLVDPSGRLIACYNYAEAYDDLVIGDLHAHSFRELWGTENHRHIINHINNVSVCNSRRGCPCRFAKYQEVFGKSSPTQGPSVSKEVAVLL